MMQPLPVSVVLICSLLLLAARISGQSAGNDWSKADLSELQDNYVKLNKLLKENVERDDPVPNFVYAHDLLLKQGNPVGPALELFIELARLKELYRCDAEDTIWLTRNQQAISKIDKGDRVHAIFTFISLTHASKCQEDYEAHFAARKAKWDEEQQQLVSLVMDPFIMQIQSQQQVKQKQARQTKNIEQRSSLKLAESRKVVASSARRQQTTKAAPKLERIDSSKEKIRDYLAGESVSKFCGIFGCTTDNRRFTDARVRKRRAVDYLKPEVVANYDSSELGEALRERESRSAKAALLKRFIGAGILFAQQRAHIPSSNSDQVADEQVSSSTERPASDGKVTGLMKRFTNNIKNLGKNKAKPTKTDSSKQENAQVQVQDEQVQANLRLANVESTENGLTQQSGPAKLTQVAADGDASGQFDPLNSHRLNKDKPNEMIRAPAIVTSDPKQEPQRQSSKLAKKNIYLRKRLSIPITKRMIMSDEYRIDKVKGSKMIWSTLRNLAAQKGIEFSIKNYNDRVREKANIERLVREYVLKPCESFHAQFKSVFPVAKFDLKYNARSTSTNEDFYRCFAEYQLCDSFIAQKSELIGKIATFAIDDIGFHKTSLRAN